MKTIDIKNQIKSCKNRIDFEERRIRQLKTLLKQTCEEEGHKWGTTTEEEIITGTDLVEFLDRGYTDEDGYHPSTSREVPVKENFWIRTCEICGKEEKERVRTKEIRRNIGPSWGNN